MPLYRNMGDNMLTINELKDLANSSVNDNINDPYLKSLFDIDTTSVYYKFLYSIVEKFKGKKTLTVELGTYCGRSTAFLAKANEEGTVLTVDMDPKPEFNAVKENLKNLKFSLGRSDDASLLKSVKNESVDVCFFDTAHEYDVVSAEVKLWAPKIKKGGVMLFDDIFMNDEMKKFWSELAYTKDYSMDLHWTGFGYAIK